MCHFITAVLPGDAQLAEVRGQTVKFGRDLTEIKNKSIASSLNPGERHFLTTRKGSCDCGTAIGTTCPESSGRPEQGAEREIRKRRRKGWSEAKIKRWLSERATDSRRRALTYQNSVRVDLLDWVEFLSGVLTSGAASEVGVLLHWYDGDFETEDITLSKRRWLSIGDLTPDFLGRVEEDRIYSFRG